MDKMEIHANVAKNRMYMELEGFFSDEEMAQMYNTFAQEMKKLGPGFDLIVNTSKFKPASRF